MFEQIIHLPLMGELMQQMSELEFFCNRVEARYGSGRSGGCR